MKPWQGIAIVAALAALGGCAQAPFVDRGETAAVGKLEDRVRQTGQFAVCYADESPETMAEVEALARETCAAIGFEPYRLWNQRFQCRLLAPHRAFYRCVDYSMVDQRGVPLNPFAKRSPKASKDRPGRQPGSDMPDSGPLLPDATGGFAIDPGGWDRAFEEDPPTPDAR